ncbi:hypothetical protein [Hathewaya massiliensis]|uniref:hypothetical protein n=1 Tax=Hathewaya massiliensis TaxID=1964382 RepID=UPI00115AE4D4|nr:hypothetical protein [Hathewaya massiliensis]
MSDSVGQISLDLGLNDITEKQIENISEKIKANVTKALSGLSNIGNIDKSLDNIQTTIKQMISSIHSQIKSNLAELKSYIENIFSSIKVKNPMDDFLDKGDSSNSKDNSTPKSTRGPPTGKALSIKVPKVDLSNNAEYIKSQIEILDKQLEIMGGKAEEQRGKIQDLRKEIENLSKPTGNKVMDFINQDTIKKLEVELSKAEEALNKFSSTSNKTTFTIDALEKKLDELGSVAKSSSSKAEEGSSIFSRIKNKISSSIKAGAGGINNTLKHLGHESTNTGRNFLGMGNMISRSFGRVLRQVFVMGVIYKALRGLISHTGSALMTNRQFVYSLNQIRTNLMVAFMPIYQAVLPAINALMRALSTVTAYIATFISAIFGKTYKQSFNAAKGLNNAKAAMGAYGKSAKKAGADTKKAAKDMEEMKGALMGFDEINQLDLDKGKKDTGDSDSSGMPPMVMPDIDVSPASAAGKAIENIINKLKAVLSSIFQPFKNAWAKEGQATIASIKYALHSILDLLGSIGKSMLTVWTNGTGEKILTVILQILQNIFNIIGDIASTFATAWNSGDIGTKIIQGLSNAFLNLLTLVKKVGDSFREVWGQIGTPLANMFMKVLKSTTDVLENLSQKLIYVWDNGGKHLFEGLVKLGAKVLELAGYIYTEFVVPFVNWFIDNIAPAIAKVMDCIGDLLDKFSTFIGWLLGDGKPVLETIIIILGSMATSFGLVTLATQAGAIATGIWSGVMAIATGVAGAFKVAITFLTSSFGIAVVAIGAVIAIGILLYKNWDEIKAFLLKTWDTIKQKALEIWTAIKEFFINTWQSIKDTASNIWNAIKQFFIDTWNSIKQNSMDVWNSIKNFFVQIWNSIKDIASTIWNSVKKFFEETWNSIKQTTTTVWNSLKEFLVGIWNGLKDLVINIWSGIKKFLEDTWNSIKNIATGIWGAIKDFFASTWNGISIIASTAWNGIKDTCKSVFNGLYSIIKDIWGSIKGVFNGIVEFVKGVFTGNWERAWNGVRDIFGSVFSGLEALAKAPLNGVIGLINGAIGGLNQISLPDWVPVIGGKGINIPKIPMLAKGGVINQPTLSMVGEAGKEAVVPLENNTEWMDKISASVANAIIAAMQFNQGNNSSDENIGDMVMQLDGVTFARLIKNYTDKENQRIGNNLIIKTT